MSVLPCFMIKNFPFHSAVEKLHIGVIELLQSTLYSFMPAWFLLESSFNCLFTLKSLIEEHARLDFSDFLSTLLTIFHIINKKFHPARLLTYLVKKQAGWNFFPTLLVYSGLLFY